MLNDELRQTILSAVDQGFDAQVAFTQDLIRFPSLRGQEHTCQDFIFEAMTSRGLAMDRWAIDVSEIDLGFGPAPITAGPRRKPAGR